MSKKQQGYYTWLTMGLLLLGVGACDRKVDRTEDIKVIRAILAQRAAAITDQNIEIYRELFLAEYNDGGVNRDRIVSDMADKFAEFTQIKFTYQRSPVDITKNTARVVQQISYHVQGLEKPAHDREILYLRRVNGQWFISAGVKLGLF